MKFKFQTNNFPIQNITKFPRYNIRNSTKNILYKNLYFSYQKFKVLNFHLKKFIININSIYLKYNENFKEIN